MKNTARTVLLTILMLLLALSGAAAAASGSGPGYASALALSLGIALQNFPEGIVVSMPLYRAGKSRTRAFAEGAISGIVEPIGAVAAFARQEGRGPLVAGAVASLKYDNVSVMLVPVRESVTVPDTKLPSPLLSPGAHTPALLLQMLAMAAVLLALGVGGWVCGRRLLARRCSLQPPRLSLSSEVPCGLL